MKKLFIQQMLTSLLLSTVVAITVLNTSRAHGRVNSNQEVHGFHFATCDENHCIEAWAERGFLSQLQFGFTTTGPTTIRLTSLKTKEAKELKGTSSTYHPKLDLITLETDDSTSLVSIKDLSVETFSKFAKAERKK